MDFPINSRNHSHAVNVLHHFFQFLYDDIRHIVVLLKANLKCFLHRIVILKHFFYYKKFSCTKKTLYCTGGDFLKNIMPKLSLTVTIGISLFFLMSMFSALVVPAMIFKVIMILGIIVSFVLALLSPKGKLKNAALTVVIIIGSLYLIGIELMGLLFRGNGF
jgi:holin-like protein